MTYFHSSKLLNFRTKVKVPFLKFTKNLLPYSFTLTKVLLLTMALETFKSQLKAKAKTLGVTNLRNSRIDAWAATLEKQNPDLKTDDDHSEKVDSFLEFIDIKEIAAYDDHKASKAKTGGKNDDKKDSDKKDSDKKDSDKKDDVDTSKDDPDMPAWAKALVEQNKTLVETVTKLQSKETRATIQERLKKDLKDIPSSFYDEWSIPEKDDDYDPFTEKVKTKWEAFTKENPVQTSTSGGTRTHQPTRGGGKSDDKATKEEIDSVVKNIM